MTKTTEIVEFAPSEVGTYGNKILSALISTEDQKKAAETKLNVADSQEKLIDFKLTQVALFLHATDKVDLHKIFQNNKEMTSILYRTILTNMGVLERKVNDADDTITYDFTDKKLKGKFDYTAELNKKDPEEFNKRRSRRNALNMRLSKVCKAALALHDSGATVTNMQISADDDGELHAEITKGPKEVMGKETKVQIHSKSVNKLDGAIATPTISGLAKVAETKHKVVVSKADSDPKQNGIDKEHSADNLLSTINVCIMQVKAQEGEFDGTCKKAMKNLLTLLEEYVN